MHEQRRMEPELQMGGRGRLIAMPAFILGIAFSGFFDGILLHQILQWHHLLSLVPGPWFRDPRVQVAADGLFHVLMFALALCGLFLVVRGRNIQKPGRFLASFVLGFGVWNIIDVFLFHWILHIHNVRLDVPRPLLWDIGWLFLFGILPVVTALGLGGNHDDPALRRAVPALLLFVTLLSGGISMVPFRTTTGLTAVLFRPGLSDVQRLEAVARSNGRLIWTDKSHDLMVVKLPPDSSRWGLYRDGAILVGGSGPAGCVTIASVGERGA